MSEAQVSVDGHTYHLPEPFMVIATQNPLEHHGTFPLPESPLNRFLLRIRLGYPDPVEERAMLSRASRRAAMEDLKPVLGAQEVLELQQTASRVHIDDSLLDYLLSIVTASRHSERLTLGVSTRGTMALAMAAKALALVRERQYCLPDDLKELAPVVLSHRVIARPTEADWDSVADAAERAVREILEAVPVPL